MSRPKGSKNKKTAAPDLKVRANQPDYKEPEAFVSPTVNVPHGTCRGCGHQETMHAENGCQHACACQKFK